MLSNITVNKAPASLGSWCALFRHTWYNHPVHWVCLRPLRKLHLRRYAWGLVVVSPCLAFGFALIFIIFNCMLVLALLPSLFAYLSCYTQVELLYLGSFYSICIWDTGSSRAIIITSTFAPFTCCILAIFALFFILEQAWWVKKNVLNEFYLF